MSSLSVKSMDPHPMHHNCHPLWKILFAFLKIFFALRSTTGYKVCMHSEHQPKTFYKDPNVRMVIWEWDWERVGLLVGCEKRELLCRKGRVSDRWGKWSELLSQQSTTRMCTTCAPSVQCAHFLNMHHPCTSQCVYTLRMPHFVLCTFHTCMFVHISYMCTIQTTNGKFSHMCTGHYSLLR